MRRFHAYQAHGKRALMKMADTPPSSLQLATNPRGSAAHQSTTCGTAERGMVSRRIQPAFLFDLSEPVRAGYRGRQGT